MIVSLINKIPGVQHAKLIGICLLICTLVGGFFYIKHLNSQIDVLNTNNQILENSISEQQMVIDGMKIDISSIQGYYQQLQTIQQEQSLKMSELQDTFRKSSSGKDRSLGELAIQKPNLIENVINEGTKDVNRCFEILTGSELKEGESIDDCK